MPHLTPCRSKFTWVILALLGSLFAAEPALVRDGNRQVLDLAGTWEAASTTLDLAWPGAGSPWKAHPVPSQTNTAWIGDDGVWGSQPVLSGIQPAKPATPPAAWFRRSVVLPALAGRRALLHCDQVAWRSAVRINAREVGGSLLGMVPNTYDITDAVVEGENAIAIGATCKAGLWDAVHGTYIAPIAPVNVGITGGVRLELVPATRIDDLWIRTSVATKRIEVEVELVNAGAFRQAVTPMAVIRAPDGLVAKVITGPAAELAPGEQRAVVLADTWSDPALWTPATPVLYRVEVALLADGREADRKAATFGFRDFTIRGRDFLLNGRRQVLLRGSWLRGDADSAENVSTAMRDELAQSNCLRLHLGFINPHTMRAADRTGMMLIPEPGWFEHGVAGVCYPLAQSARWLPAAEDMIARFVKQYRNHPSIVMWSLANEWSWHHVQPEVMAVAERIIQATRRADPTRPLQGDGEVTWDGRLETINIHYPEADTGTVGRTWNNSGWVIPNDFAWLQDKGVSHAWRGDFAWDRPLMIGECHAQDGFEPEEGSAYMGESGYDTVAWRWQSFGGRGMFEPQQGNGYIDMVRMACDHYRAAGVACLNPWVGRNRDIIPPIVARPLDYHPSLYGGETAERRFLVANDGAQSWHGLHLQSGLQVAGRMVWEDRQPLVAGPGMRLTPTLAIRPPPVAMPTAARLVVRLCWIRIAEQRELFRHEEDVWIMPRASLAGVDPAAIALVDDQAGTTGRALAALGLALTAGASDDVALAGKRVLVIGEGAAARADLGAAARFAKAGGRVVLLHQTACDPFLPGQPAIDPRHASTFSWRSMDHAGLEGLAEGQLRFWRPDHVVATESLIRPALGGISISGGRYGMHWSPLSEVRHGAGAAIFCQYRLADRLAVEPAAARILANLVRWAATAPPPPPLASLRVAPGVSDADRAALRAAAVQTVEGLDGDGPVLVDARHPPAVGDLDRLRAQVEAGGRLWLRGLDPASAPAVGRLLPWTPAFTPLPDKTIGASRRSDHPFIQGLGTSDFYWARGPASTRKQTAGLGGPVLVAPALEAMSALTDPVLLAVIPVGKGQILVDAVAWGQAMPAESERVGRIVSTLARNLGAMVQVPMARRFRFSHIDLARQANRGYLDEIADDGVGGWTDQGDNDMRYFLINHAGKADAGGMEVAVQPFPTETLFNGIPFRLVDPKANADKAVITLRGGVHDPQAPAEVRGLAAGGLRADRLWFLHAATWCPGGETAEPMARYEIVYVDGSRAVVPVVPGRSIANWWHPKVLPEAEIAWTGRNAKCGTIAVYNMAWDNPQPGKAIAAIDVIGNLGPAQLVLLGITAGIDDSPGVDAAAAWDCTRHAGGAVPSACGGAPLVGNGVVDMVGGRKALRIQGGQQLSSPLKDGPLAQGKPFALETEVAALAKPEEYYGGIVSAGTYRAAGVRLLLRSDLRVVVEHFAGPGPEHATALISREPLTLGRFYTLRYEHDGARGRLLIDGTEHALAECRPPAAWGGTVHAGSVNGTGYRFEGAYAGIRILALHRP